MRVVADGKWNDRQSDLDGQDLPFACKKPHTTTSSTTTTVTTASKPSTPGSLVVVKVDFHSNVSLPFLRVSKRMT